MIAEDEMEIENQVIIQIIQLIQEQLEAETIQISSLVNHEDPKVSKMVADILSNSIEISPNWGIKFNLIIEQPGSNYQYDIESSLGRLKLKNIEKMIRHNQDAFNQAGSDESIDALMRVHQHLIELRSALTEKWGTVILK
jgi:hypothetical protein